MIKQKQSEINSKQGICHSSLILSPRNDLDLPFMLEMVYIILISSDSTPGSFNLLVLTVLFMRRFVIVSMLLFSVQER